MRPSIYRLPKTNSPTQYNLLLRVDYDPYSSVADPNNPNELFYTGEVTIKIKPNEATNQISLHISSIVRLTDTNPTVTDSATNQIVAVTSTERDDTNQILKINLAALLNVENNYDVLMRFSSRTTSSGFYFHGYKENSQFE